MFQDLIIRAVKLQRMLNLEAKEMWSTKVKIQIREEEEPDKQDEGICTDAPWIPCAAEISRLSL